MIRLRRRVRQALAAGDRVARVTDDHGVEDAHVGCLGVARRGDERRPELVLAGGAADPDPTHPGIGDHALADLDVIGAARDGDGGERRTGDAQTREHETMGADHADTGDATRGHDAIGLDVLDPREHHAVAGRFAAGADVLEHDVVRGPRGTKVRVVDHQRDARRGHEVSAEHDVLRRTELRAR
jgi:hypothetical protein